MRDSFSYVLLLDIYGELLSKGQREVLDMRYNADMSLSEIAQELGGVTRQSVSCSMKNGEQRLEELEALLGFAARLRKISGELDRAEDILAQLSHKAGGCGEQISALGDLLKHIRSEL